MPRRFGGEKTATMGTTSTNRHTRRAHRRQGTPNPSSSASHSSGHPRLYAYLRYSSENQRGNVSLALQREAIRSYARTHYGHDTITEKIDEAKSGTSFAGREGFASIYGEIGKGDRLLVYKYDRLGRTVLESLQNLQRLEDEYGVTVESVTEPNSVLVRNLLLTMAEEYSTQLSGRCKAALEAVARDGYAANGPAFGYKIEREGKRAKFVIDPKPAETVRQIFKLRAKGNSHRTITKILNERGEASPRGGQWSVGGIHFLLNNEVYIGTVRTGMHERKKGRKGCRERPRSEWTVKEGAHQAIIGQELWRKVRSLDAGKHHHRTTPGHKATYLWTGFLRCSRCGHNLVRHRSRSSVYYGCQAARNQGAEWPCYKRCIVQADHIGRAVIGAIRDKLYGPEWEARIIKLVQQELETPDTKRIDRLNKQIEELSTRIERAYPRLASASDDLYEALLAGIDKMKAEKAEKQAALASIHTGSVVNVPDIVAAVRERLDRLWQVIESGAVDEGRQLLAEHIEKIVVESDGQATVFPVTDALLGSFSGGGSWRPQNFLNGSNARAVKPIRLMLKLSGRSA